MIEIKIGTVGFVVLLLLALSLAMTVGIFAGIDVGKQKMALVCNVMEQNAGCPFVCASDGCVCSGAKTVQVIG